MFNSFMAMFYSAKCLLSEAVRGGDEDDGVAAEQHGAAAVEGVVRPQQRALTRGLVTLRVTA